MAKDFETKSFAMDIVTWRKIFLRIIKRSPVMEVTGETIGRPGQSVYSSILQVLHPLWPFPCSPEIGDKVRLYAIDHPCCVRCGHPFAATYRHVLGERLSPPVNTFSFF